MAKKVTKKVRAKRIKMYKQTILNERFAHTIIINMLIILMVLFIAALKSDKASGNNQNEGRINFAMYESEVNDHNIANSPATALKEVKFSRNLSEDDKYLLAKIAMAEAEGESFKTKIFVILTVLNRADSSNKCFPNTIKEVIFEENKGIYQFSPVMPGGRWWRVEPNEECWEAVNIVNGMKDDITFGALYFEACSGESWHSRNLEFLFKSDNTRFYK